MRIYRVIEESVNFGEYQDIPLKAFTSLARAQNFKAMQEDDEKDLQEQSYTCSFCKYGFGDNEPCNKLELKEDKCINFLHTYIKSTYRIEEEEVEE